MKRWHFFVTLLLLVCLISGSALGTARMTVRRLGIAPLLGHCPTRERLVELSNANRTRIVEAVRQAGHSPAVAEQVANAMCLGQVDSVLIPNGTILQTMAWYGENGNGRLGVHTVLTPELSLSPSMLEDGQNVRAWIFKTKVESKTIVWVVPERCGNLCRWGVEIEVSVRPEPILVPTPEPPQLRFYYAQAPPRSRVSLGNRQYLGSTYSAMSVQFAAKPPDINVQVSQSTGQVSNGNTINVDNGNNIQVANTNENVVQNNNSATAQANNVTPVNVVVNTAGGNASGSASGSGVQDSGTNQDNTNF